MIQIQENMAEQRNIKDKLENEQEKLHVEYNKVKKKRIINHCTVLILLLLTLIAFHFPNKMIYKQRYIIFCF